ncbi:MAG TPA: glycoside hydrolase domain-containing protein [Myxococcaceae bacterium]|nr:glycoside hydrolase domain-containing protein [Myxococcaceae bacterium]
MQEMVGSGSPAVGVTVRRLLPLTMMMLAVFAGPARAQEIRDGRQLIREMQRLDANEGWVRTGSELLWTHNGGATWTNVTPGRGLEGVTGTDFLDSTRGWLAGVDVTAAERLVVLETRDGGRSWGELPVAASALETGDVYKRAEVQFIDAERGWLLGQVATGQAFSLGRLFRTTDGGRSWESLPPPPAAGRILFVDAGRGFMVGAPVAEKLYTTEDGGRSWRELPLASGFALYGVPVFHSASEGVVAVTLPGEAPRLVLFATRDGGRTWQEDASFDLPAGDYTEPVAVALNAGGRLVALGVNDAVTFKTDSTARSQSLAGDVGAVSVRTLSFAGNHGWALASEGGCDAFSCQQSTRLVALDASGRQAAPRELLVRTFSEERPKPGAEGPTTYGSTTSFDKGFDKCAAATTSQMQSWRSSSPYKDANIYYGGSARACSQPNLSSSWVSTVFAQGWRLIPTWVGPQAPCSGYGNTFSYDAATARSQGLSEADAAVNAASALGLGASTPLYYDLENYNETNATCTTAVRAFVNAWVERVKQRGYIAGVYGNAYDAQHDWIPGVISNPPDAVWIASWACSAGTTSCGWSPTVWGISGLSDSYWTNNQRVRQYWGDHTETYGGVSFAIDSNYANAPVATSGGGGGGGGSFTCDDGDSCFSMYGPSQYWHRETSCGGSSVGTGGDLYWTYVNGSVTSNYVRWAPNFSGTGGAGNYTVSVWISRCFGTSQQAKYRIYHNGVSDYVTVNQNNVYDSWVTLGTFYFSNNGSEFVELSDATGESYSTYRQISFDAVRFSR